MRHILKRAAAVAVLLAACGEQPTTPPIAPAAAPGRVLLTLSTDSAAALEALVADAIGRSAPSVARMRAPAFT